MTLDSRVHLVLLELLDHQVLLVKLDSRDLVVNEAVLETVEQLVHQEDLVRRELREIQDSREVLVFLVRQALSALSVYRVQKVHRVLMVYRELLAHREIRGRRGRLDHRASVVSLDSLEHKEVRVE